MSIHEVPGVRLPLQTSYASPSPHAVFMYSTGAEGSVTLQLRDTDDLDDKSGLASVLARLQQEDATLSISYQDSEMLTEGSIDVLLGAGSLHTTGNGGTTATFDLFDSESGQELTLSPQTFPGSTEPFINDNSDSMGVAGDTDTVESTEETKSVPDSSKLAVKKPRPKASSPNRQGPQQCQVCGKVFGNASALAKHKLTHSDERKYVCSMCGKAFKRQDHLNGHMLTHRNKKPYECKAEGCGKSYCDARSLRRHTENHHTNNNNNNNNNNNSNNNAAANSSAATPTSTATGDEASSSAATCIQYAPPPNQQTPSAPPPPYPATSSPASTTSGTSKQNQSQLQQLLASEPASATPSSSPAPTTKAPSGSPNNDGLTKQQLDLIHQIMQQTQQQAAAHQKQAASSKSGSGTTTTTTKSTSSSSSSKSRNWNSQNASGGANKSNGGNSGQQASGGAASTGTAKHQQQSQQQQQQQQDPKPVECNLCHRKFKNTPALNGHMRLHGGYFKKDSESKKCEKKEVSGPPLQTASMSVRALIEEKIIQKRITNPQHGNSAQQSGSAQSVQLAYSSSESTSGTRTTAPPPQYTSPGSGNKESEMNIKLSSFVVPAPPAQSNNSSEKLRRHSDSEHFVPPRVPATGDVQEAVALAELLLKRGGKVAVKRASSDPGPQQLQLSFQAQPDGYSLAGVTYQAEDGGYFSPSLQEDVFQQVSVQDTMLLHGVDPAQLAESIQFQAASLLQDQATAEQLQDIASLEDYQNAGLPHSPGVGQYQSQNHTSVHQDFQAVLNSPLPVSLADFSAYGHQTIVTSTGGIHSSLSSPIPKDLSSGYQSTHSPLHSQSKDYVSYTSSPLAVQSPLPSPLTHHDSPSFTYPTPPASQEGQSPSFGHSTLVTSALPLASPHAAQQNTDNFVQSVIAHGGHVPPVSSPLSAAFYTSTMSSSAAVEEALSEVLPVETLGQQGSCMGSSHMRSHGLGLYHPSPPPQSPLSATPVPSPLSMSSVPASSSSVSSPLPPTAFTPTQGQVSFPLSPHHTLQSQMMPNSEDPLLSSSPKDFGSRKKFDFGSTHSFKLIGNGTVDLGLANSGLTGIVVDSNGELKFLQATNHHLHHHHHHHHNSHGDHHQHQSKGIVVSSSGSIGGGTNMNLAVIGSSGAFHRKTEAAMQRMVPKPASVGSSSTQYINSSGTSYRSQRPKLQVSLDGIKEEVDDDVFLSPTSIPASPIRSSRKKSRPEPLYILPHAHPTYQSRLRTPRTSEDSSSSPPPLYTPPPMLSPSRNGQGLFWQTTMSSSSGPHSSSTWPSSTCKNGSGGESSSDESQQGPNSGSNSTIETDTTPHINVGPAFQCTVPQWNPDREKANREPSYEHLLWDPGISKVCSDSEVEMYLEFACCAAVPGGGRNKEYALHLLHMCRGNIHEAMLKLMQPTPALPPGHPLLAYQYCESDRWSAEEMDTFHQGLLKYDKDFRSISQEIGSKTIKQCVQFYYVWKKVCPEEYKRLRLLRRRQNVDDSGRLEMEFDDIKTEDSRHSIPSFNSRAALNGHIRIHGGGVCGRSPTPDKRPATATPPTLGDILEEFPCKICGKVFNKVKSRSAHMKSHRPPDAEPKKPKLDPHKMEAAEQSLGRAAGVTTTISTTTRHA